MKISRTVRTIGLLVCLLAASQVYAEAAVAVDSREPTRATLSLVQALVLGFVEGVTEYLPVSSTGHLLIVEHLLGMDTDERQKQAAESLAICIQSGAILAVLVLYFGRIRQILSGMMGRDPEGLKLLINLLVAFFPAAVIGVLFNKLIKEYLFSVMSVATALFVGGVLILFQSLLGKKTDQDAGKELAQMSAPDALFIGVMQCLAFWPGFSRSLATILGCRWSGFRMMAAVEFSFLLGLVTLSAATAYEGLKHGKEMIADYGLTMPLISLFVAFVAAVISVRFMVGALSRFGMNPFGHYRILLALACLCWL